MNKKLKYFFDNFEIIVGSMTMSVTVTLVILNVFLRYGLGVQFAWIEEVSVGCFIWTVFLGAAAGYRSRSLIGVDILTQILPENMRRILSVIVQGLLLLLSGLLFYLSLNYTMSSNKITAALEISYVYINFSLVLAFGLMSLYSAVFFAKGILELMGKIPVSSKETEEEVA